MKSVVFYNNKGGVGKTTFAVPALCVLRSTTACARSRSGSIVRAMCSAGSRVSAPAL